MPLIFVAELVAWVPRNSHVSRSSKNCFWASELPARKHGLDAFWIILNPINRLNLVALAICAMATDISIMVFW
jgi:hypothetical protein